MVETTEVYMDGGDLVRVVRTPLAQRKWSDEAIEEMQEWWQSETRSAWACVPPSVRLLTLIAIANGQDDPCESVTRFQIGLIPDLPEDVQGGARDYLWAVLNHEEFGAALLWEQLMALLLECAAEATAEIASGSSTLHEWRMWFLRRFNELPASLLWAFYEDLQAEDSKAESVDWEAHSCDCCGDSLKPTDALRLSLFSYCYDWFKKTMVLIDENPSVFTGLDEYDYGIQWND